MRFLRLEFSKVKFKEVSLPLFYPFISLQLPFFPHTFLTTLYIINSDIEHIMIKAFAFILLSLNNTWYEIIYFRHTKVSHIDPQEHSVQKPLGIVCVGVCLAVSSWSLLQGGTNTNIVESVL